MRVATTVFLNSVVAATVSGVAVCLPFGDVILVAWGMMLAYRIRDYSGHRGQWATMFGTQTVVIVAIVLAALAAPCKTTDTILNNRRLTLPSAEMTLGELAAMSASLEPTDWPRWVQVHCDESDLQKSVQFPSKDLTVRQFVDAVEAQTPLRHHFGTCGTCGRSVLFGPNWIFSMRLRRPD